MALTSDLKAIGERIKNGIDHVIEDAASKEPSIEATVSGALTDAGLGELAPVVAAVIPALISFAEKHLAPAAETPAAPEAAAAPEIAATAAPAAPAPAKTQ